MPKSYISIPAAVRQTLTETIEDIGNAMTLLRESATDADSGNDSGNDNDNELPSPTTAAPTTTAPTTAAPTTAAPTTAAPATMAAPITTAPDTGVIWANIVNELMLLPEANALRLYGHITMLWTTATTPPTTAAPTTAAPTSAAPTTAAPSTAAPTMQEEE